MRVKQIPQYDGVMNGCTILNQISLHELYDSGTMQVTAKHPLMADMQHVSQHVAPEARPPRSDNLHCANIATFLPPTNTR